MTSSPGSSRRLVAVLGPTAGGKSALALLLARRLGCEIINCDSRQIYRGMDIGTAKPTPNERREIPHHLFDLVEPTQEYSAGAYSRAARRCIEDLWRLGRRPLVVGGTGFYFQALMDGVPSAPADTGLRERILERLHDEGLQVLVDELRRLDPVGAA
ncbi:MAG TPA: tRNA dimethylallyltransferase, partial [Candidatus Ozemobacteraceae bacterium]|nr:tRNA dimethylallyltransferase [Candidatus Ozemobacteraceae bacterium]